MFVLFWLEGWEGVLRIYDKDNNSSYDNDSRSGFKCLSRPPPEKTSHKKGAAKA